MSEAHKWYKGCQVRRDRDGALEKVLAVRASTILLDGGDHRDGGYRESNTHLHFPYRGYSMLAEFAGFSNIQEYAMQFQKGCTVEVIRRSKGYYRVGETFEVFDVQYTGDASHNPKFRVKGRGWFTVSNFKVQGGQSMKTIPSTKFFCVAEENSSSTRRYFDGGGDPSQAEKDANAFAKKRIVEGATGVAVMVATKVIRPKVDVDEVSF